MEKILCIYHGADLDGKMSAAIVKKWFLGKKADEKWIFVSDYTKNMDEFPENLLVLFPWNYGYDIPNNGFIQKFNKIIMCDISWEPELMFQLYTDFGTNFIWIDHHKSAIKKVNDRLGVGVALEGIQTQIEAACELTWKYFFSNEKIPKLVEYLGMYDTFRHMGTEEEEYIRIFQFGARTLMPDVDECHVYLESFLNDEHDDNRHLGKIYGKGQSIYIYLKQEAEIIRKSEFEITILGYRFLCVNQAAFNPKNFEIDFHKEGYDGYAIFRYDSKINKFRWTLYSEKTDVSVIATAFGGGGHHSAAGCEIDIEKMLYALKNKIL